MQSTWTASSWACPEGLRSRRGWVSTFQCCLYRHPKDPAGASQGFPMAASTCHPESTELLTLVSQVRERSCAMEGGATWT